MKRDTNQLESIVELHGVISHAIAPVMSKLAKRCRVPKITASVLPGFSSRAFCINHVDTASVQSAIDERSLNLDGASGV